MKKYVMKAVVGVLRCIYAPIKLRRTKKKITIISRQGDEPTVDVALLSDYIRGNHPDVECKVMCRRLEGTNKIAYGFHMISQMKNIAESRAVVLDGYCIAASVLNHKEQVQIVQMWHALAAIKKFGYQSVGRPGGRSREVAEAMHMHRGYDYVIAPSPATGKHFCEGFNADEKTLRFIGLPRVDVIMKAGSDSREADDFRKKVREEYGVNEKQEIVLYAPTFRKGRGVDADSLSGVIDTDRYKLIVKLHPLDDLSGVSDNKYSTYEWFRVCDRIVTDYSAIGIEALLVEKPVYYYVYDIEAYEYQTGLNIDPLEEMPHAAAKSGEEMAELLSRDYDFEELRRFREKYITVDTDCCTKRLGEFIYGLTC